MRTSSPRFRVYASLPVYLTSSTFWLYRIAFHVSRATSNASFGGSHASPPFGGWLMVELKCIW